MEPWQMTGMWLIIFLQAVEVIAKVYKASKGDHVERQTPGYNAADAVLMTLLLVFFLTLVL
jgi:hypothetical protein